MSEEVLCKCHERASFSQVKHGPNEGKWFFACANWKEEALNCKFFRWAAPSAFKKVKQEITLPKPMIRKPARSPSMSPPPREMTPIIADKEVPEALRKFVANAVYDYHRAMLQRSLDEAKERVKELTIEMREFQEKMNNQETP
jgi:hypothetical protein